MPYPVLGTQSYLICHMCAFSWRSAHTLLWRNKDTTKKKKKQNTVFKIVKKVDVFKEIWTVTMG